MSGYNYDLNPWDDNYDANAAQSGQQNNYGGYTEGYSNPAADYSGADQDTGYAQDQQQQQRKDQYQYQDESQQQAAQEPGKKHSLFGGFLRQRIPACGPILDTLSSINLPFIDALVQHINRDLLVSKMFYFFFYSAFGSLFPLMGVYFKQQGMNPAQVGILTGVRPFIEIFSAPFWNSLAGRFQKSKALLLFSLLSWIVFTYSLAHIRPPASACVAYNNKDYVLYIPYSGDDLSNVEPMSSADAQQSETGTTEAKSNNEMFLNHLPASLKEGAQEKEGKDQILASEENQNDQRRRRRSLSSRMSKRRRRDASQSRFTYSIDSSAVADRENVDAQILDSDDVDLENDFDDKFIDNGDEVARWSSFESNQQPAGDTNELDQQHLHSQTGDRWRRSADVKDIDDVLGESDESDPADEQDQNQSQNEEEQRARQEGSPAAKADEDREGDSEGEGEGEGEGESPASEAKQQRERGNNNSKATKAATTATTTMATTTTTRATTRATISGQVSGLEQLPERTNGAGVNKTKRIYKQRHKTPPTHIVGMSPITVEYTVNYNKEKHSRFVTPMFSTVVYKLDDVKEVFFLLLLLISLGEFFSAPALTLADSATLSYLGDNIDLYGRQRMFGSFSWAITLLLVGVALDNATTIADHPCGPHLRERSYTVCFVIFSLLMACAFLTATQFRFNYQLKGAKSANGGQAIMVATTSSTNQTDSSVTTTALDGSSTAGANIDQLYASTQPRSIFNTAPPVNAPPPSNNPQDGKEKFEFLDKWRSAIFAQRTREVPEWVNVFRQFSNPLHLTYLFITWFLGCGVGMVFTFLFWHLQDVGGTPTLFGICSVINHISEILAYFFSFSFIKRFGHTRVLSVGLGCNVIRFLYVAFLTDPYYALPFELVQGITHAACFAACCSYMSHVSKPELRTSTQGVMQGLHHGIGRACGALLGGYMINAIGSRASFCIYGLLSGCVLMGFLYIRKKASESIADEDVKVDDSEALGGYGAPQGVPSAIPSKIGQTVPAAQDIDYQW